METNKFIGTWGEEKLFPFWLASSQVEHVLTIEKFKVRYCESCRERREVKREKKK